MFLSVVLCIFGEVFPVSCLLFVRQVGELSCLIGAPLAKALCHVSIKNQ